MISHVIKKNIKCVHRIKCVKVRTLFQKNKYKVRFARADQLCLKRLMMTNGSKSRRLMLRRVDDDDRPYMRLGKYKIICF
jgi:hypothetical protein